MRCDIGLRLAPLIVISLVALSCDGGEPSQGGFPPPVTGGSSTIGPGVISRFALVVNESDRTLSLFIVDTATGRLIPRGYVTTGAAPHAVAVDPLIRFLYVANADDDTVSGYRIDHSSGRLTPVSGSPFALPIGAAPSSLVLPPGGETLFVANEGLGTISAFRVESTGTLASRTSIPISPRPTSLRLEAGGSILYVGHDGTLTEDGKVSAYAVTGADLTLIDEEVVGRGPIRIAADVAGDRLYVLHSTNAAVTILSADPLSGTLTVAGSWSAPAGTVALAIEPGGQYGYAINETDQTITGYTIGGTGALSPLGGAATATGIAPSRIMVDSQGRYIYVTNTGSRDVGAYAIDDATGALTVVGAVRTQGGPSALALVTANQSATAVSRYAYLAHTGLSSLGAYRVSATSGQLAVLAVTSVDQALGAPTTVAVDPFERFVYAAHSSSGAISGYRIGSTGRITATSQALGLTRSFALDPSGRFLFAVEGGSPDGRLVPYSIDATNGTVAAIAAAAVTIGADPVAAAVDPSGKVVLVADGAAQSLSSFTINPLTGALAGPITVSLGIQPLALAIDPRGRYAYIVGGEAAPFRIEGYSIDATTGGLAIAGPAGSTGDRPVDLAIAPNGRFAFVANAGAASISSYAVDESTGGLSLLALTAEQTGALPASLAIDSSGRFLYSANSSGTVSRFGITSSGSLRSNGPVLLPTGSAPASMALSLTLQ